MNIMPVNNVGQGTETTLLSMLVFVNTARYSGFVLNRVDKPSVNDPPPSFASAKAGMAKPPIKRPTPFRVSLTATDFNPPNIA